MHISRNLIPQAQINLKYLGPFDHKGLILDLHDRTIWGKGFWKLNVALLKLPNTVQEIVKTIKDHEAQKYTQDPLIWWVKVKVGVLRPVQQPGSYWDWSSELPLVGTNMVGHIKT